jgi:hypothetical protein
MYQQWGWASNIDLVLSIAGVYVAVLGIQASNENTLRLARLYLCGTILVGIGWMLFNYFVTVQVNEAVEEERRQHHRPNEDDDAAIPSMSDSDIYKAALSVMLLPGMVWILCCLRAFQFQHLLAEAEEEASTRIRAELELSQDNNVAEQQQQLAAPDHDEELALQNETARIT